MGGICVYSNSLLLYVTRDSNSKYELEICQQFPSLEYSVQMTDEPVICTERDTIVRRITKL